MVKKWKGEDPFEADAAEPASSIGSKNVDEYMRGYREASNTASNRLSCLSLAHNHADTQEIILGRAKAYFDWVTNA